MLLICALAGAAFVRLPQPVLIAYIVVGIAAGPAGFGLAPPGGLQVRSGDAQDREFLETLPLARTPWVVSTMPDLASNRLLLHALTERGHGGDLAIVARDDPTGAALMSAGSPIVLHPVRDAVDYAAERLTWPRNCRRTGM